MSKVEEKTTIHLTTQYNDGDVHEITISKLAVLDIYQMAELFESLLLAAEYHPNSIKEILKIEE